MDIRRTSLGELELFVELAKLGSLREVARCQGIEVAQLSRSLKRLESRIGKRLFERSPRGLLLTPDGMLLRVAVEKGLKELGLISQSESKTKSSKIHLEGVGAPSFLMNTLSLSVVGHLQSKKLIDGAKVVELPPDRLVLSGLRGIVSLAFHAGKLEWPRSWVSEKVGNLKWGLFASKKFFTETKMTESEVMAHDFVYPVYWSPEGLRDAEDRCPILLRHRKKSIGVSSGWMALDAIESFPSLTFVPKSLVNSVNADRFVEINVQGWASVSYPIYVSAQSDRISKNLFNRVIETSKEVLKRSN